MGLLGCLQTVATGSGVIVSEHGVSGEFWLELSSMGSRE